MSGHPQISAEAFSAAPGVGTFGSSAFSGKDVLVARLRALVVALVLTTLVACEDEPSPDIADPTPSSSAPSPSESASSPTSSPTVEELSPEETVRAWVDARNQALQDGDTGQVRALTDPTCEGCIGLIESIEEVYEAGGEYRTKGWRIKSMKSKGAASRPTVDAAMVIAGGSTINAAGEAPVAYPPDRRIVVFKLHAANGALVIDFVGFLS
ncbi:DUF6318 family protein [Nocardioides sp.]|uniref:DUF6318 family protein n=1 Tax=Nocardioides sp. TaxID=35761 RepID=UPI001A23C2CE|nr:DUF6318 family protein [Nocardioides sp.]MBJ7358750.1 hypothetical protein [Nocardioides sp.]